MQQTTVNIEKDDTVWSVAGDIVHGILTQPVPGWIVLLLILGYFVKPVGRFLLDWKFGITSTPPVDKP